MTSREPRDGDRVSRLLLAGLLTTVVDGTFATVQAVFINRSTVTRLWQGVASVLLGSGAFDGGTRTVVIGLLMHVLVAFTWSAVFLFVVMRWSWVRARLDSAAGIVTVAAIYGPLIWVAMSTVVIPALVQRPPSFTSRWLVQLIGHFPFVGLPIVAMSARRARA
jgi:hypothetical protein